MKSRERRSLISSELSSPPLPCQKVSPQKMSEYMPENICQVECQIGCQNICQIEIDRMFWWGSLEVSNFD